MQSSPINGSTTVPSNIFSIYSKSGALVVNIPIAGGLVTYGGQMAAGTTANGFFGFDGSTNPTNIKGPNGTHIYIGTVAMTHTNFPNVVGVVGARPSLHRSPCTMHRGVQPRHLRDDRELMTRTTV